MELVGRKGGPCTPFPTAGYYELSLSCSVSQALIQFFPCLSIVSLISLSPILEGNPAARKGVHGPPFLPTNSSFWLNLGPYLVSNVSMTLFYDVIMCCIRNNTNFCKNRIFDVIMTSYDVITDVMTT